MLEHTLTHTSIFMYVLAYFPVVVRVFIYPNLIVICVPSLIEIAPGVPELCLSGVIYHQILH
jgi:hypothetical protein